LRLFACACCRSVWHLLSDQRNRAAVEVAEGFADGERDDRELLAANETSYTVYANMSAPGSGFANAAVGISRSSWEAAVAATIAAMPYTGYGDSIRSARIAIEQAEAAAGYSAVEDHPAGPIADYAKQAAEGAVRGSHADLAREVFGNPFRPVTLEPVWLSPTVVALGRGIYEGRAFDRLPIMADALQEAGCEDEQLLGHCRSPGLHVRGCWLVDLVLEKE
jgi:hypothetical protein